MNYNFENNNSKKKRMGEKSVTKKRTNNYKTITRLKNGFIAWPENKLSTTQENPGLEISEGRSESGGYVAYPKK
jgi:hypothetical protein